MRIKQGQQVSPRTSALTRNGRTREQTGRFTFQGRNLFPEPPRYPPFQQDFKCGGPFSGRSEAFGHNFASGYGMSGKFDRPSSSWARKFTFKPNGGQNVSFGQNFDSFPEGNHQANHNRGGENLGNVGNKPRYKEKLPVVITTLRCCLRILCT